MSYVLVLTPGTNRVYRSGQWYVAGPGEDSYTRRLENARVFETRDAAERDRTDNERVASVAALIHSPRVDTWRD